MRNEATPALHTIDYYASDSPYSASCPS